MLALSYMLALLLTLGAASPLEKRSQALDDCLSAAGLSPISSSSSDYSSTVLPFNLRLQRFPAAVVFPKSIEAVSSAVKCGNELGIAVVARGGGHSYASYGLGATNGALMIDLSSLHSIVVDSDGQAHVGGGARLGDTALALNAKGRAMSHGVCPWVGIGGHAAFGGYGPSSRKWGLTLDNIVAYDVVLADGTIKQGLTASEDADLFWALRGSAPSFGIVTTYHFRTYQRPSTVIVSTYSYPAGALSSTTAAQVFLAFQTFGKTKAPSALGLKINIFKGKSVLAGASFQGSRAEYDQVIAPLLSSLPGGYTSSVKTLDWIGSLKEVAGGQPLSSQGASDYHDTFFAKSLMVPSATPLTQAALEAFFNYLWTTATSSNWFVEFDIYGGLGSNINARSLVYSSFAHRAMLLGGQMYASSPNYGLPYPSDNLNFVQGMYAALTNPMLGAWAGTQGAYANYVDPTLTKDEAKALYWGSQYPRLASLKKRYDPTNVFRGGLAIVGA
ncbi:glucooligosaccharide oxidase [Leucosporidium creatinivorum]|uniref:Glucooligosaccharide oxidase n=1 Tax=Leucosporidium creatinivorum TaxID=106004 RepID=A0A1Y2FNC5_9BASI|nr:glucooligosaccharide oxidase [Leucosporidium creatinivorum]